MTERPYRSLRDTTDDMWSHTVRGSIGRIRTKANTVGLIRDGVRPYSELTAVEKDLWHISEELDRLVSELFIELERLKKVRP